MALSLADGDEAEEVVEDVVVAVEAPVGEADPVLEAAQQLVVLVLEAAKR